MKTITRLSFTLTIAVFVLCAALPRHTEASTTSSVGSPKVKEGELTAALRTGYSKAEETSSQDERFRSRASVVYGFTDYYSAELIANFDDRKNYNMEFESLKLENNFYLLKADRYGFDFGIRANYKHADGDKKPNEAEIGFYELIPLNQYEMRFNQIFSHEVGEDSEDGASAEMRFQITRKFGESTRLGIEGFHDLGNLSEMSGYDAQEHTIGPVVKGTIFENLSYEAGYRAGISQNAPDHNFKLFLSRNF
jgi:hypothetical protein